MYMQWKYTLQFAVCTKSMEPFELYSKEKVNIFCLIKFLFVKVTCLVNVNKICGLLRNG